MAEQPKQKTSNQHTVPRCYLKRFASDKLCFFAFNKSFQKSREIGTRSATVQEDFYDLHPNTLVDPDTDTQWVETTFSKLEARYEQVLSAAISEAAAGRISVETGSSLAQFMTLQWLRTVGMRKALLDADTFLEGRKSGTSWRTSPANPLPVNNRTVLHLLRSLQYLELQGESRRLSFRALDIEQIGHVYEGLLDHTAKRATEPMLGLLGAKGKETEVPLSELERLHEKGEADLLAFLNDETGRQEKTLKRGLGLPLEGDDAKKLKAACGTDESLFARVRPFSGLLRNDTFDRPVVIRKGSVFVTAGTDRRSSGTHYTPRSLTEPIVQYTLEPLVYVGPAEGKPKEEWTLRSAKELLDLKICDMACGSGAFLVQVCRYLSELLVESWENAEKQHKLASRVASAPGVTTGITPYGELSTGAPGELLIPKDTNERIIYARRIVAQRCLYGVDKNHLAAEMAKLSLWLLTLAKDKPFEFLDHAIRCGDSLVGIHNTDQLRKFNLDGKGEDNTLFLQFLDPKIKEAIALRRQITEMQANTVEDVEAQDRMLREANEQIDRLKCAADMLVGAEFLQWDQKEIIEEELEHEDGDDENWQPSWVKAKKENAQFRRAARIKAAIEVAVHFYDSDLETFQSERAIWLNGQVTFHWPLEFPEVMVERGGFDAFVGNPPFMGGKKITGNLGIEHRDFLLAVLASGVRGNADLCAYFFLRTKGVLRRNGHVGLLATNSIAQGDTREVGLEQLINSGFTLYRAVQSQKWPGQANLEIAHVWMRFGTWNGAFTLNQSRADGITPFLTESAKAIGNPETLQANVDGAFIGVVLYGEGFVVSAEDADRLLHENDLNRKIIKAYLNGEDVNSSPTQEAQRFAIDFGKMTLEEAKLYPECMRIIEETVKPFRQTVGEKKMRDDWWLHQRTRPAMQKAISGLKRILVCARVSPSCAVTFVPTNQLLNDKLVVFPFSDYDAFTLLQSDFHWNWVRHYSTTFGGSTLNYNPTDCFGTFPFPAETSIVGGRVLSNLSRVGEVTFSTRQKVMRERTEGLTKTYNRFHNPDETSADIQKLRELHVEMDIAVAAAYGWSELDLGHGFHETKQGVRYTISESARREVLARLLKLNHERYAEEVAQGLHDKKGKAKKPAGGKGRRMKAASDGPALWRDEDEEPEPADADADQPPDEEEPARIRQTRNATSANDDAASRPTPIEEVESDDIMAAFRQAARGRGWMERDELLKEVSLGLGYRRLGSKVEETLRGQLRAAIRRHIIEANGANLVRGATAALGDYPLEELREAFRSVMTKGTKYERDDVIHALAHHLGFARVTENSRDALKSAINSAIRHGVLGYEGSVIWREEN